jgi:ssDNA-binding Zn-finger/Zn-ribbon topoisomerase 1
MSKIVTAAEQLLKLADELEARAEMNTVFACTDCGHSKTLKNINDSIRKYAAESKTACDLGAMTVTVNDQVKCPECGQPMAYAPTPESERFYIATANEGLEELHTPETEESKEAMEVTAAGFDDLKKAITKAQTFGTKFVSALKTDIAKQFTEQAAEDTAHPDKHSGVDRATFDPNFGALVRKGEALVKGTGESMHVNASPLLGPDAVDGAASLSSYIQSIIDHETQPQIKDEMKAFLQHQLNLPAAPHTLSEHSRPLAAEEGVQETTPNEPSLINQEKLARYLA